MTGSELERWLLWSLGLNYTVLLVWFVIFAYAHEALYRLHGRWFRLSPEAFDAIHYAAMAAYKIAIIVLNLVPYLALLAMHQAA
ncbi:hypothetical protein EWI61_11820 [Methylolobus aquaticus]|nr:hypothetical protein EWI61_11820 [Methylolobus aquaticus]